MNTYLAGVDCISSAKRSKYFSANTTIGSVLEGAYPSIMDKYSLQSIPGICLSRYASVQRRYNAETLRRSSALAVNYEKTS
jgi:hypothetical protein